MRASSRNIARNAASEANFGKMVLTANSFSKPCLPCRRATQTWPIPPCHAASSAGRASASFASMETAVDHVTGAHRVMMADIVRRVNDPVAILEQLVRYRTDADGGNERPLADYLAGMLRSLGADEVLMGDVPREDKKPASWVYARFGAPRVLVNAHLDTVPPNADWSSDAFVPRIDGYRLFALGAADTKAPSPRSSRRSPRRARRTPASSSRVTRSTAAS